jgi:SAM-dependent methyltransferase
MMDPVLAEVRRFYEENHDGIEAARRSHHYFYDYLTRALQARVPAGQHVLEIGCGTGHVLSALRPARGVGVDVSPKAIAAARRAHTGENLHFFEGDGTDPALLAQLGGPFDFVLLVNVATHLTDVQGAVEALHGVLHSRSRVLIYSYSRVWQPVLRLAEVLRLKYEAPPEAWLPVEEVANMLDLADFEIVRRDYQIVFPAGVPLLADLLNRYVGRLPVVELFSLMYGLVARRHK